MFARYASDSDPERSGSGRDFRWRNEPQEDTFNYNHMRINSIKNVKNLKGKRVLVRCDFNVPIKNGKVKDDFKIQKSLPTIEYLLSKGAVVVLASHLGRPEGKYDKRLSLKPVANYLQEALKRRVEFFKLSELSKLSKSGNLAMLENVRFCADEKKDAGTFSSDLAVLADIFVMDGFGVSHRSAASVTGVARFLPTYAGLLLEQEIRGLTKVVLSPQKPFVVILGGAKIETKIPVLKNLLGKADHILLGGGLVNTYLYAKGYKVGDSLIDKDFKKQALLYGGKKKVVTPVDAVVGTFDGQKHRVVKIDQDFKLKKGQGIYDIGPQTVRLYAKYIKKAQTIVWNGAMGYFEQHPYEYGTYSMARLLAARAKGRAFGVCGGGETVEVLRKLILLDDIDLVSTGGGAMLEFLSGAKLPGVDVVMKKTSRVLGINH